MPLTPATRLGAYEILAPLGAGGMGEVYRARDTRLGRDVAVKVLPADVTTQPDRLARFEREARTVAGLNHPSIVTLFSVEDDQGVRFLTMELVEGESLDRHVAPGGLPIARLLDIGIAISDALTAAHEKGVVHRDIKPANVMLTREGRVKVLDFGLAKVEPTDARVEAARADTLAAPPSSRSQLVGTVPYMAPEQVRGEGVDARTDLFALGVLLYELATGRRPFTGATLADVASSILRDVPTPLAGVRADLPSDFDRIVGRCLEKNPRERFQTALDVVNELRGLRRTFERGTPLSPTPTADQVASIAVLPFANRSANPEDEYFSDGLADELLGVLGRIRGLRVAARSSAFTFKGRAVTVAEVGKVLNVATVLEGSVRKAGNRVRITVQLVKVSDGYHLWSETYDRTLEDILAVQDEIARSVVKELRTTLLGEEADSKASGEAKAEVARAAQGRTTNPEAHRLYLQARHLLAQMAQDSTARAIGDLNEALKLDPEFALGWTELSRAYSHQAGTGWRPLAEGFALARAAVERALSLEPDLAVAHALAGWISMWNSDSPGAERSFRRALELDPRNSLALRGVGTVAYYRGHFEEATLFGRAAIDQDPLNAGAYHILASTHYAAGDLAAAETACRRSLDLAPGRAGTRSLLALVLMDQRRTQHALAEAMREPDEQWRLYGLAITHHAADHGEESNEALRELIAKYAENDAWQIAQIYAHRGESDRAFEWLERAHALRDPGLIELKPSPLCRTLHDDPRWNAFLSKVGLAN